MKPADVKRKYAEKKLCTVPFAHEMATLAALFQPLLPFAVLSPLIPSLSSVYRYTFHLPSYITTQGPSSSLALVFIDHSLLRALGKSGLMAFKTNLRLILDPSWGDEVDGSVKGGAWETMRESGLRVWSTLKWDVEKKEASAWMDERFVEGVGGKHWACGLYRTDVWMPVFEKPVVVEGLVKRGELWGQ